MPSTRSMRALSSLVDGATNTANPRPSRSLSKKSKRNIEDTDPPVLTSSPENVKKARMASSSSALEAPVLPSPGANQMLPAVLNFSFDTAKQHLVNADARFEGVFATLPCRPFEQLEKVDPFRTLVTSILGQQISWLAARSIIHKFIRLYYPSLPEKPPGIGSGDPKVPQEVFPTASQVANTDVVTLKTAGLSTRKAEYVQDLASRFADGRLTNQKLIEADDEELARLLIEVRGIGRWTVDMFAIFSLRRPDILPVGDLGVQRGVVRWFLSLHSPNDAVTISPKKLPKPQGTVSSDQDASREGDAPAILSDSHMPITPIKGKAPDSLQDVETPPTSPDKAGGLATGSMTLFSEPLTPSTNRKLNLSVSSDVNDPKGVAVQKTPPALPEGLTVMSLKSRLNGKKIKGALLSPKEMEDLTEPWRPYRSLGVYYMWALAEESSSK